MYANSPLGDEGTTADALTPEQRRRLKQDLTQVAAQTRELLPGEFVVGSELSTGVNGPEATVAVRPPVGSVVSAGYSPEDPDVTIDEDERNDIAAGLAASAALQVKQALAEQENATAR